MGEKGEIYLKKNNFVIDQKGNVYQNASFAYDPNRLVSMQENGWDNLELVDKLKIVDFRRPRYLKKEGTSFYRSTEESGRLSQGYGYRY